MKVLFYGNISKCSTFPFTVARIQHRYFFKPWKTYTRTYGQWSEYSSYEDIFIDLETGKSASIATKIAIQGYRIKLEKEKHLNKFFDAYQKATVESEPIKVTI